MNIPVSKRTLAVALGLAVFAFPALACDKPAATDRVSKFVERGDIQHPTRVSDGFAAEVTEKFWSSANAAQRQQLAADIACSIGTEPVSFTRDRSVLGTFRGGKYEPRN